MAYKINTLRCLKCGVCLPKCPQSAIIADAPIRENDGTVLQPTHIDPRKCNDCAICVSEEFWCPAQAISKA
jgi:ferredoxin